MPLLDWIGQNTALARLQLAMRHDRVHHCYIFHGPEGVGKAGIALDFVRTLLCESPVSRPNGELGLPLLGADDPLRDYCGQCPTCRQTEAGNHPDVNVVLREPGRSTISVKVLNEKFLEKAHVKSYTGRLKAFVIPEAERIAEAGWNKLLKTLEEPPAHMLTILAAPALESVLPTILSRAQVLRFHPLPVGFVEELLTKTHKIDAGQAAFLARFTGGSPGEALRRSKTGLYAMKREIVDRLAGLDEPEMFDLADSILGFAKNESKSAAEEEPAEAEGEAGEGGEAPAAAPAGEAVRTNLRTALGLMAGFYRDVLLFGAGTEPALLTNADQAGAVAKAAGRISPEAASRAISDLAAADAQIVQNVLPNLALEAVLGELAGAPN